MITIVTLSRLLQWRLFFMMLLAPAPKASWTVWLVLSLTLRHTQSTTSWSFILSKIPSHPKTTKSWNDLMSNFLMSGELITTCGLPPLATSFASRSPNVQHTLNLPGNTLTGPMMISGGIYLPCSSTPVATVAVLTWDCLLIDLTTVIMNPFLLSFFSWLVIFRERCYISSIISTQNSSWISHIDAITRASNDQQDDSTWTTLLMSSRISHRSLQERLLGCHETSSYCFFRVLWKRRLLDDKLMQVISQEVSTSSTTMSIENSKEGALGPLLTLSWMRLQDVENDAHPVLIVISNDTLVCVCSIRSNNAILLVGTLTLINRYLNSWCTLYGCSHFSLFRVIDGVVYKVLSHLAFLVDDGRDQGVLL